MENVIFVVVFLIICAILGTLANYFEEYWHVDFTPEDVNISFGRFKDE